MKYYLEEQQKLHAKQYHYTKRKSTVNAISYIADKIKIREATYILELFVDFYACFRSHVLAEVNTSSHL